jgi:hypothetical protein
MTTSGGPQQTERRRRLLVALVAAPAVMTALGLCAMEGWRFRPATSRSSLVSSATLADAIERDDVQRAYAFLRAGQNPNELIAAVHPVLTGGRFVLVSPLVWAVAMNSRQNVLMLLGFGARLDRATDSRAACLADELGHEEIARLLRVYGDPRPPTPCPARKVGEPSLLSLLAGSS